LQTINIRNQTVFSSFFRTIAGVITCGIGLAFSPGFAGGTTLYVFFPTTIRPLVLQNQLSSDLPGYKVTVFGRYSDFTDKVMLDTPDAILSKPDVIRQLGSYSLMSSGLRNGAADEPYYLLSAAQSDRPPASGVRTVGTVDFMGRRGMDSLASVLFKSVPRMKRVSKVEDLLPLLAFGMAEEVLVSAHNADYLAATAKISFSRREVPGGRIGIIALGVRKGVPAEKTVQQIRKLPRETCQMLEMESWK